MVIIVAGLGWGGGFPLTCAVHHGHAHGVGTGHHEATVVHHLMMELLIPVSYRRESSTACKKWEWALIPCTVPNH